MLLRYVLQKPFASCAMVSGRACEALLALPGKLMKGSPHDSCWLGLQTVPCLCSVWPRWTLKGSCKAWRRAERVSPLGLLKVNVMSVEAPAESLAAREAVFGGAEHVAPWHIPEGEGRPWCVGLVGQQAGFAESP